MAEWFKAHAWKACVANPHRGFESLSLRQRCHRLEGRFVWRLVFHPLGVWSSALNTKRQTQANRQAADEVIEAAYRLCAILGDHPELGRVREFSEGSRTGIRSFVITDFPNYVIFYRPVPLFRAGGGRAP